MRRFGCIILLIGLAVAAFVAFRFVHGWTETGPATTDISITVPEGSSSSTGESSIKRSSTFLLAARAGGQTSGQANVGTAYAGGAGAAGDTSAGGGGGGAGGYAGAGTNGTNGVNSTAGSGGSASGGNSGGGGGVRIWAPRMTPTTGALGAPDAAAAADAEAEAEAASAALRSARSLFSACSR